MRHRSNRREEDSAWSHCPILKGSETRIGIERYTDKITDVMHTILTAENAGTPRIAQSLSCGSRRVEMTKLNKSRRTPRLGGRLRYSGRSICAFCNLSE